MLLLKQGSNVSAVARLVTLKENARNLPHNQLVHPVQGDEAEAADAAILTLGAETEVAVALGAADMGMEEDAEEADMALQLILVNPITLTNMAIMANMAIKTRIKGLG